MALSLTYILQLQMIMHVGKESPSIYLAAAALRSENNNIY